MAENTPVDPLKGLSSLERMYRQKLEDLGVDVEAFMFTPPVSWMPKQFGFRITWRDTKKTRVGMVPWDFNTFGTIVEEAQNP